MKKKFLSILLCLTLALGVFPVSAFALGRFEDVDEVTLQNTDILGTIGIISDSKTKTFRPNDNLTRAEFCKMAVIAMGNEKLVSSYKNVSIFPDVRANHWASGYIGVAAKAEGHFVKGYADGTFGPSNVISYGEALTILMRVLGYTDEDCGGLWPDGYISLAKKAGLAIDGVAKLGPITRAQAAGLFVKMLNAETKTGAKYYTKLGTAVSDMKISSIEKSTGKVKFADGTTKYMAVACDASTLIGKTGTAVLNDEGKLLLFLPNAVIKAAAPASAAIIVSNDGSVAGFDSLTAGSKTYSLCRNGITIKASEIKKYDVATYDASTDTINLCDTRISTYYANCSPSVSKATEVTILGGTKYSVLSTAQDMLAKFKPGMNVCFMFTADGQIAGATDNAGYSNMLAAVDNAGNVRLILGTELITMPGIKLESKNSGKIVSLKETKEGSFIGTNKVSAAAGKLDFENGLLGEFKLAETYMLFEEGSPAQKDDFDAVIEGKNIDYYRLNSLGQVDLISIKNITDETVAAGKAKLGTTWISGMDDAGYEAVTLSVVFGNTENDCTAPVGLGEKVEEGANLALIYRAGMYRRFYELTKLGTVTKASWIGKNTVNFGGISYIVSEDVIFYNIDTKMFMNAEDAFTYADEYTLYSYKDVVYMVEVNAVV